MNRDQLIPKLLDHRGPIFYLEIGTNGDKGGLFYVVREIDSWSLKVSKEEVMFSTEFDSKYQLTLPLGFYRKAIENCWFLFRQDALEAANDLNGGKRIDKKIPWPQGYYE